MVISIISLLSSIILANFSEARKKARVAKIIQEMNQIRNLGSVLEQDDGGWDNFFVTPAYIGGTVPNCDAGGSSLDSVVAIDEQIREAQGDLDCGTAAPDSGVLMEGISAQSVRNPASNWAWWAAWTKLPGGGCWCVDSTGNSKSVPAIPWNVNRINLVCGGDDGGGGDLCQ